MQDKKKSFWQSEFFYKYRHSAGAIIGSLLLLAAILIATIGPYLAPQNPYDLTQISLADAYLPPAWAEGGQAQFPLGTDNQGRCLMSAIIYGSRSSIFIGLMGMLGSCILGTALGLVAGYFGGRTESFIMRVADVQLSFPSMLLALAIMAVFGRGIGKLLIALVAVGWVTYARTVRGETLKVKSLDYIQAARTLGLPKRQILLRHVLPNVSNSIVVLATMQVGSFILTEATLSFLGVGVPITKPSLGLLVKSGFDVLFSGLWWVSVFPGFYIMLIVFGINLLGDFLRDELNPKLQGV
ncbi:MAG: ABC transporter permease [Eubacteriales bacterium]|nr:ABC transporter permease [Clostridiales bacterium]MDY5835857.1 ABC transporter permease [Eubacteriales bacterium]